MTNDTSEEIVKSAGEIAKASGKAIDATREMGGFLNRVFGDLVQDAVGLAADRLKYFRIERAIELAHKTERLLVEKGISETQCVPPKISGHLLPA